MNCAIGSSRQKIYSVVHDGRLFIFGLVVPEISGVLQGNAFFRVLTWHSLAQRFGTITRALFAKSFSCSAARAAQFLNLTAISPFNLAAPGSTLLTGGFSLGWSIISSQLSASTSTEAQAISILTSRSRTDINHVICTGTGVNREAGTSDYLGHVFLPFRSLVVQDALAAGTKIKLFATDDLVPELRRDVHITTLANTARNFHDRTTAAA